MLIPNYLPAIGLLQNSANLRLLTALSLHVTLHRHCDKTTSNVLNLCTQLMSFVPSVETSRWAILRSYHQQSAKYCEVGARGGWRHKKTQNYYEFIVQIRLFFNNKSYKSSCWHHNAPCSNFILRNVSWTNWILHRRGFWPRFKHLNSGINLMSLRISSKLKMTISESGSSYVYIYFLKLRD